MRPGALLAAAWLALNTSPLLAALEAPEREYQLFLLSVHRGNEVTVYAAYRPAPGDPDTLVVQRSLRMSPNESRVEVSAAACPGLRAAIDALERTPWPSIRLGPAPEEPYVDRERFVGYSFNGMIGYTDATSWESKLYVQEVHGRPREPFTEWAHQLVGTVDNCIARGSG